MPFKPMPKPKPGPEPWYCCDCGNGPWNTSTDVACAFCYHRRCSGCKTRNAVASIKDRYLPAQTSITPTRPKEAKKLPENGGRQGASPPAARGSPVFGSHELNSSTEEPNTSAPFACFWYKFDPDKHPSCRDHQFKTVEALARGHLQVHHDNPDVSFNAIEVIRNIVDTESTTPHMWDDHHLQPWRRGFVALFPVFASIENDLDPTWGTSLLENADLADSKRKEHYQCFMLSASTVGTSRQLTTAQRTTNLPAGSPDEDTVMQSFPDARMPFWPTVRSLLAPAARMLGQVYETKSADGLNAGKRASRALLTGQADSENLIANETTSTDLPESQVSPNPVASTERVIITASPTPSSDSVLDTPQESPDSLQFSQPADTQQRLRLFDLDNRVGSSSDSDNESTPEPFKSRARQSLARQRRSWTPECRPPHIGQHLDELQATPIDHVQYSRNYRPMSEPSEPVDGPNDVAEASTSRKRTGGQRRRRNAIQKQLSHSAEFAKGADEPKCVTGIIATRGSQWDRVFGCPFHKDQPYNSTFKDCAAWFTAHEEQMRLEHVEWHIQQGHLGVAFDTALLGSDLRELPNSLNGLLASLQRQQQKEALWQATMARLFDKYEHIKHMLNPYAFSDLLDGGRWGFWHVSVRLRQPNHSDPAQRIGTGRNQLGWNYIPQDMGWSSPSISRASSSQQNSLTPLRSTEVSLRPYQITFRRDGNLAGGSTRQDVARIHELADEFLLQVQPHLRGSVSVEMQVFERPEMQSTAGSEELSSHHNHIVACTPVSRDCIPPLSNVCAHDQSAPQQLQTIAAQPIQGTTEISLCNGYYNSCSAACNMKQRPEQLPSISAAVFDGDRGLVKRSRTPCHTSGSLQTTSDPSTSYHKELPVTRSQLELPEVPAMARDVWDEILHSDSMNLDSEIPDIADDANFNDFMLSSNLDTQMDVSFANDMTEALRSDQYFNLGANEFEEASSSDTQHLKGKWPAGRYNNER